LEKSTLKT